MSFGLRISFGRICRRKAFADDMKKRSNERPADQRIVNIVRIFHEDGSEEVYEKELEKQLIREKERK